MDTINEYQWIPTLRGGKEARSDHEIQPEHQPHLCKTRWGANHILRGPGITLRIHNISAVQQARGFGGFVGLVRVIYDPAVSAPHAPRRKHKPTYPIRLNRLERVNFRLYGVRARNLRRLGCVLREMGLTSPFHWGPRPDKPIKSPTPWASKEGKV